MAPRPLRRLTVLGLGLIGGSLAKALRARGAVDEIVGWGHREASLQAGLAAGVIDRYELDLAAAVAGAELVVIATPTLIAETLLEQLAPLLEPGTLLTDVASVKGNIEAAARRAFGTPPPTLVPGHPIAGSEQSGVAAARADLFEHHRVILTPLPETDPAALDRVRALWALTGAEVVAMSVAEHDATLAATSHLPHVLAYALVDAVAGAPEQRGVLASAAGGFRDTTRIAASDPGLWRDIALANREALLAAIDGFDAHLAELRGAIDRSDGESIMAAFSRAKAARDAFTDLLHARREPAGDAGDD